MNYKRKFKLDLHNVCDKLWDYYNSNEVLRDVIDPEKKLSLLVKRPGTCFDKPIVPWNEVKAGDLLWYEVVDLSGKGRTDVKPGWYNIVITKKYAGVVFFKILNDDLKPITGILHFAINSLAADKLAYPYIIVLSKGWEVSDCDNPRQLFEYV